MTATYYQYRAKDGTRMALFKIAAGSVDSIPFEPREKLDLKVTPEGHVLISRTTPKETTPEDVVIKIQEGITRLKEEIYHVRAGGILAVKECLGSVWGAERLDTDVALRTAAADPSKFVALEETIEKSEYKGYEDVMDRARAGYLALKPFYIKWKKLMAEKEALEKEYMERATELQPI